MPKGPSRTVFSTESNSVVFYYSVVNLLRIVIHYSKYSKSVQNVVIHYIFSSESLLVVNSLQIANSLRVLFLVCRGPLGAEVPTSDLPTGGGSGNSLGHFVSEVKKRGRPSKCPPECLPSKFADFECAFPYNSLEKI